MSFPDSGTIVGFSLSGINVDELEADDTSTISDIVETTFLSTF